jgi:uncharacterized lipoprotein YajG
MADITDWREIEQVLADAVRAQGFHVGKDSSGRLVVDIDEGDGGLTLNLEEVAHRIAAEASRRA